MIQDHSGPEPVVIGEVDRSGAPIAVYEGAIYLHEGRQFSIESLDWENGIARARETEADYYTRASSATSLAVLEEIESELAGDCVRARGRLHVTSQATTYRIIKRYTHETLGYGQISIPPAEFDTTGYWVYLTPDLTTRLVAENIILEPNDYGPNWQQQRDIARARDGFRCTQCGAPERDDREHDVHHVRPFREFESYREANRLDNLVTLCRSCHRAAEAASGTRSALGGLSSVVHNLATLYLMCSPNDIGVLVEQKSSATRAPTITVYDYAAGGLGLATRLYDLHEDLLYGALELVRDCGCEDGCPACVGPSGEVGAGTKDLTLRLLEAMTGQEAGPEW